MDWLWSVCCYYNPPTSTTWVHNLVKESSCYNPLLQRHQYTILSKSLVTIPLFNISTPSSQRALLLRSHASKTWVHHIVKEPCYVRMLQQHQYTIRSLVHAKGQVRHIVLARCFYRPNSAAWVGWSVSCQLSWLPRHFLVPILSWPDLGVLVLKKKSISRGI